MTTASVLLKVRRMFEDMGEVFSAQRGGDGITTVFELPENIIDTVVVGTQPFGGGTVTALVLGTDYTLDPYNGIVVLLGGPLAVGTLLLVSGRSYETWTDADLTDYIWVAMAQHSAGRNPTVFLDPVDGAMPPTNVLPYVEERALALLTARDIVRDQANAAARDITIDTGDGTVIPRSNRYNQLIQQAQTLDAQYIDLVSKLGIQSIDTLTMSTLRRVSMTTNRLVPVYEAREWDDRFFAQRIMPPIDTGIGSQGAIITYRGEWVSNLTYAVNDLVDLAGARFLCLTANIDVQPVQDVAAGTDGINGLNWALSYVDSGMAGYFGGW